MDSRQIAVGAEAADKREVGADLPALAAGPVAPIAAHLFRKEHVLAALGVARALEHSERQPGKIFGLFLLPGREPSPERRRGLANPVRKMLEQTVQIVGRQGIGAGRLAQCFYQGKPNVGSGRSPEGRHEEG